MGAKFDKLKAKLSGEPGVTDPGGLAAAIGRKKYGKENYDKAAAKDKSPKLKNKKVKKGEDEMEPPVDIDNNDVEGEIEEVAKAMEFSTMDPISEIQKAVLELGPEGLYKALPHMTEENKELLNDILEDMNKSHTLPLAAPRKLTNVGGDNYVQEDVSGDEADEAIFEASVAEDDQHQKHQGGSHDQPYKLDWEGQMIKSLDDFTMEELSTFGEVYKAMKMKKADKERYEKDEKYDKKEAAEAYEGRDDAEKKGEKGRAGAYEKEIEEDMTDADYDKDKAEGKKKFEKAVSASPKLWGSTKPRGVGIYKNGDGKSVESKVKDIEGDKKVNEVLDDTKESKKDDVLRELRESKMKKAKHMMKNMMKKEMEKECPNEEGGKAELMKNKMRKALIEVLNEEYTDEEIHKAMKKADEKERYDKDAAYDKKEMEEAYEGRDDAEKKGEKEKAGKFEGDIEQDADHEDYDKDMAKKMKKARDLFREAMLTDNEDVADVLITKAKEMMDKGGPGSGPRKEGRKGKDRYVADAGSGGKVRPSEDHGVSQLNREVKELKRKSKKQPVKTISDPKHLEAMGYKVKKGWGLEIYPQEDGSWLTKAVELDKEPKLSEFSQVDPKKSDGNALAENEGIKKMKEPEVAEASKDTADEALAELGKMKKSIKWYGEANDAFKAGRLGRHNYASSVNEYYDAALYKAANPTQEEEMRKSYNKQDINDLIEMGMTTTRVEQEAEGRMENFKKSQGNFTRTSFSEDDMIATCHLSKEDLNKL